MNATFFVRDPLTPEGTYPVIYHLDGVAWHDAPPPPRSHRHWAQTYGRMDPLKLVQRCPCSAIRTVPGPWLTEEEVGGAHSRLAPDPPGPPEPPNPPPLRYMWTRLMDWRQWRWVQRAAERRICPDSPNGRHEWEQVHTTGSIPVFDPSECIHCGRSG